MLLLCSASQCFRLLAIPHLHLPNRSKSHCKPLDEWLCLAFGWLFWPIEPKTNPPLLLILKGLLGSFCKKNFFLPLVSPRKLHRRPPARLSLTEIPGATTLFRKFRGYSEYSENSEGTESYGPIRAATVQGAPPQPANEIDLVNRDILGNYIF